MLASVNYKFEQSERQLDHILRSSSIFCNEISNQKHPITLTVATTQLLPQNQRSAYSQTFTGNAYTSKLSQRGDN